MIVRITSGITGFDELTVPGDDLGFAWEESLKTQ